MVAIACRNRRTESTSVSTITAKVRFERPRSTIASLTDVTIVHMRATPAQAFAVPLMAEADTSSVMTLTVDRLLDASSPVLRDTNPLAWELARKIAPLVEAQPPEAVAEKDVLDALLLVRKRVGPGPRSYQNE